MKCFICNRNDLKKVYSLKTKDILHCKNDGLFIAQKTSKDKTYGQEYFSNEPNKFNKSYFKNKIISIKHLIEIIKPKILDIGCGWGDFEEVLEKEKSPYLGIDINKEAIKICKKKGLNCQLQNLNQWKNGSMKQWDCITMFQVIEHLKNPIPILKSAKKLLKRNGLLLITTPNNNSPLRKLMGAKWTVYSEPSHYIFYNKSTLKKTLELAGFKKIRVKLDSHRFLSSTYILNRLLDTDYRLPALPIPTDPFGDLELTATT